MIYTDIAEAPLDTPPLADIVDVPDSEKPSALNLDTLRLPQAAHASPAHYIIPFRRLIKKGTKGRDVIGAKRALWKANGLPAPKGATQTFGDIAVKQLQEFQHKHGLKATGALDAATLKKLAPWLDAYSFLLYVGYAPGDGKKAKQNAFVAYMLWGYNQRALIHYAQLRPMGFLADLHHLPVWEDCSAFFTKAAKYAGFPDPNKQRPPYNGLGWTGTLAQGGREVSLAQAVAGCAALYGPAPNFSHVAGCIGGGRGVSHGSEGAPYLVDITYRPDLGMIRAYI